MRKEPGEQVEDPATTRRGRRLRGIIKAAVSAAALWLLARQVEGAAVLAALGAVDPLAFAAVFMTYVAAQVVTAYRWRLIARAVGFQDSLPEMVRYYFIGMFFNLLGPATLGGDAVRSLYLGRRDGRRLIAAQTVLFDRLVGLAMLLLVAAAALSLWGSFGLPYPLVVVVLAATPAILMGWWLLPPVARLALGPSSRVVHRIDGELRPLWRDASTLARVAGLSVGFHVLQIGALVLLGTSLGIGAPWRYYFIFHPLVTTLGAVPVSVAGLGVREVGYAWFLQRVSVTAESAVAFALLWFAVMALASLTGGVVYWTGGESLPRLRAKAAPTSSS